VSIPIEWRTHAASGNVRSTGEMLRPGRAGRSHDARGNREGDLERMANQLLHESPGMIDDIPGERLDVTVVLPCYNEQNHVVKEIERITDALDATSLRYELLVIDDCSTDRTLETVQQAQARFPHLRVMPLHRNSGSGTARRIGTHQARGEVVVWTDADMTYPNERIPEFVELLAKDPTIDQVVGARTTEQGSHKLLRVPAKWFIRKTAERLSGTRIPDLNSGFRAFRTDVARQYVNQLPVGFSCVTTITMTFLAGGYSVKYVPIEYAKRAGESKFHWYKDTRRYASQVVRMILSYNPLRIFMPIGLTLFTVGFVKLLVDVIGKDFRVPTNTLLILFAAFQVIMIGLLADLVTRSTRDRNEKPPASV
jgi:polyisoprenyl-phosphate glycosyltransferase